MVQVALRKLHRIPVRDFGSREHDQPPFLGEASSLCALFVKKHELLEPWAHWHFGYLLSASEFPVPNGIHLSW